jgi:DNA-directed RNA polymerase specialized sigma24 family protein
VKRQTQDRLKHFDILLEWLDSDRDRAAEKYEMIRQSLIQIFIWKRCLDAESLADETLDRVMLRVPELRETYKGNPSAYIHAVAKNLLTEQMPVRTVQLETSVPENPRTTDIKTEKMSDCLDRCLSNLSPYSRDLILDYYSEDHSKKISHRKDLAEELGISVEQLRVRMHRIRKTLEACIQACMGPESLV